MLERKRAQKYSQLHNHDSALEAGQTESIVMEDLMPESDTAATAAAAAAAAAAEGEAKAGAY